MDSFVSYLISIGLTAFGVSIVVFGTRTASGSLLVWAILGLMPVVVGISSLLGDVRNGHAGY